MSASAMLVETAMGRLRAVRELSQVSDGPPLQGAAPYAVVEAGAEADWGHKSGAGREVRLAVTIRERGERPERLRRLMRLAEAELEHVGGAKAGWRIVTFTFLRSRIAASNRDGWSGVIDYRARLLAVPDG